MYFAHKLAHSCLPAIAASGRTKMHTHTTHGTPKTERLGVLRVWKLESPNQNQNPDGVANTDML